MKYTGAEPPLDWDAVTITTGRLRPWPAGSVHVTDVCEAEPTGVQGTTPTVTMIFPTTAPNEVP